MLNSNSSSQLPLPRLDRIRLALEETLAMLPHLHLALGEAMLLHRSHLARLQQLGPFPLLVPSLPLMLHRSLVAAMHSKNHLRLSHRKHR